MIRRPKYRTRNGISSLPEYRYRIRLLDDVIFYATPNSVQRKLNKALDEYSKNDILLVEDFIKILGLSTFAKMVDLNIDLGSNYSWLGWDKQVHGNVEFELIPSFYTKDEIIIDIVPTKTPEYLDVRDYRGVYQSYQDLLVMN